MVRYSSGLSLSQRYLTILHANHLIGVNDTKYIMLMATPGIALDLEYNNCPQFSALISEIEGVNPVPILPWVIINVFLKSYC